MNQDEDVLEEIVGFRSVLENPVGNPTDYTCVPAKQVCQCFFAPDANLSHERFVRNRRFGRVKMERRLAILRIFLCGCQVWQANCDGSVQVEIPSVLKVLRKGRMVCRFERKLSSS